MTRWLQYSPCSFSFFSWRNRRKVRINRDPSETFINSMAIPDRVFCALFISPIGFASSIEYSRMNNGAVSGLCFSHKHRLLARRARVLARQHDHWRLSNPPYRQIRHAISDKRLEIFPPMYMHQISYSLGSQDFFQATTIWTIGNCLDPTYATYETRNRTPIKYSLNSRFQFN